MHNMRKLLLFILVTVTFGICANNQLPRYYVIRIDLNTMNEAQLAKIKQEIVAANNQLKKELRKDSLLFCCCGAGILTGIMGTSFSKFPRRTSLVSMAIGAVSGGLFFNQLINKFAKELRASEYERDLKFLSAIQGKS